MALPRRLLAECLGTALLLAVVIGSGVMAERLSGGNVAVALLANTLATVGGLYVLIEVFGPVSGAHFNPAVSLTLAVRGELAAGALGPYVAAQLLGAVLGAILVWGLWSASGALMTAIFPPEAQARAAALQIVAIGVIMAAILLLRPRGLLGEQVTVSRHLEE